MYYSLLLAFVIAADQLSKQWILNTFQLYETREVIPGFFNLVYVTNTGAAFSMLAGVDSPWRHYFFLIVGGVAIIGLTLGYIYYRRDHLLYLFAFGCVAGGAAGNVIDRLRHGAVIDFLDVYIGQYHWPAFNVADSAICIGAVIFVYLTILESKKNKKRGS